MQAPQPKDTLATPLPDEPERPATDDPLLPGWPHGAVTRVTDGCFIVRTVPKCPANEVGVCAEKLGLN